MTNSATLDDTSRVEAPPLRRPLKPFAKLARELGLHVATLGRWRDKGILRDGERVRLWACRLGGRWVSTDRAMTDFIGRLNDDRQAEAGPATRTPAARSGAAEAAE